MSKKNIRLYDPYLLFSFLLGLIPAFFIIHIVAQDFDSYFIIAESFLRFKAYAFVPVFLDESLKNIGLLSRAPLLPIFLAMSMSIFGKNLLGIYLPILICRLLITPLAYLVARFFLPEEIAFLAASMTIFFPKLQTFSLSDFEADSFILLFYLLAIFFYILYKRKKSKLLIIINGAILGLLTLAKESGLLISLGFLIAVLLEEILFLKLKVKKIIKNLFYILIPYLMLVCPFFLFTLIKQGTLYFTGSFMNKSINNISGNLMLLIKTIPLYIGLEELSLNAPLKAQIINILILLFLVMGILYFISKKQFTLIFPSLILISALSVLNKDSLGGDTPANFELIVILAFMMPVISIFIFKGFILSINSLIQIFKFDNKLKRLFVFICCLFLMFKFINNFFSKPFYLLETNGEYYINFQTVIEKKTLLPANIFLKDKQNNYVVEEPQTVSFMKEQFRAKKVDVFTHDFKVTLLAPLLTGIIFTILKLILI